MQWDTDGQENGDKLNLSRPVPGLSDLLGVRKNQYIGALALLK